MSFVFVRDHKGTKFFENIKKIEIYLHTKKIMCNFAAVKNISICE